MAAPLYLTKGELRGKLLTRLGYGGLGAAAGMFVPMADDLLEEAQEQLYEIFTDEKGIREWEITTGVNQRWYDIPDTCDIDHIEGMWVQQNGDYWHPLTRGISPAHDSDYDDIDDYPYRYDIRANPFPLSSQLQTNGDFSITDVSVQGGTGFRWDASLWEITGGQLRPTTTTLAFAASTVPITPGLSYDIEYTVLGAALTAIHLGGNDIDVDGVPISTAIGTHRHRVTAISNAAFIVIGSAPATSVSIDDVSIRQVTSEEARTQIEVWPKPDDNYLMKIEGPMIVGPFVQDSDRASFDSRLILLYAIAFGKAHLGKQDAKSAMDAWTTRLNRIKANQHGTRRYVRQNPNRPEINVRSRPKVV